MFLTVNINFLDCMFFLSPLCLNDGNTCSFHLPQVSQTQYKWLMLTVTDVKDL